MSAYRDAVLADNPIHYWRCNDSAGGYLQDSRAVTPHPLIAQGQQIGAGYSGPVSDGGAAMVDANYGFAWYDTETLTAPLSVEFWYWVAYSQGLTQILINVGTLAGVSTCQVRLTTTRNLQTFGNASNHTTPSQYSVSTWHHVVVTFDGTNMRTYVDGSLTNTTPQGAFSVASSYVLGTGALNANPMAGSISEYAIYASALSATRVSAHYSAADNVGTNPTNNGQIASSGFSPLPFGPDLAAILAAVRREI